MEAIAMPQDDANVTVSMRFSNHLDISKANMQLDQIAAFTGALFQPDIPQNAGTMLRMCACLGLAAAIVEPAEFPVTDKHFRRAGMDYLDHVEIDRYPHWRAPGAGPLGAGSFC
jgi:hypothetical protein